jgi:hypothetical protein
LSVGFPPEAAQGFGKDRDYFHSGNFCSVFVPFVVAGAWLGLILLLFVWSFVGLFVCWVRI